MKLICVVRVRGSRGIRRDIEQSLRNINLTRVNHMIFLPYTPALKGVLQKIKDYATWGEIDEKVYKKIVEKYGKKKVFRLKPPKKGYGSVKLPFPDGALGNRKDKINELVENML